MRDELHLSDGELVRAADGEAGSGAGKVRAHLESCAECRARAARFEATIAELAGAQRSSLDSELPSMSGARALLRARLADASARESSFISRLRFSTGSLSGAFGIAVLVAMAAVSSVLAFRQSGATSEYLPLLSPEQRVLPDRNLTPGSARPASLQEICVLAHEQVVKEVSPIQRQKVLEEYGIPSARAGEYEVDYLITPGLGGNDDIRNLWPQPYHSSTWNAQLKDILEERLHQMVCSDQLELSVAQKAISSNWIAAYQKYVTDLQPTVNGVKDL